MKKFSQISEDDKWDKIRAHVAASKAMTDRYGGVYQNTPKGGGYVTGHDPKKKDHAIIAVNKTSGSRDAQHDEHEEHSVHIKHLKER